MLEAHGACEKEQMAGVMHMLRAVVHAVVFAVGPLDRKNAQVTSESKIFDGLMERKKPNRTNKGAIGASKVPKIVIFTSSWGSEKWVFW